MRRSDRFRHQQFKNREQWKIYRLAFSDNLTQETLESDISKMEQKCENCGALMFKEETLVLL